MKLLITGGTGLVGCAIQKIKNNYNYDFVFISSKDCDLTDFNKTNELFFKEKPDYVIHLAAYVGGLYKNIKYKVDMLEINLMINYNVLKCCHIHNVKKVISCLSTCVFPDKTEYPIDEANLHNGPPHNSNYPYSYAKRFLEIQSRTYQQQYNKNFICIIPTNIYGPNDNFSLENGHCIPSLVHKCYLAKKNNIPFTVLGTGTPLRQFIYSEDLAELTMWVLENYNNNEPIILSVCEDDEISIKDIALTISRIFNYNKIEFNTNYVDGQYKKTTNNKKLLELYENYKFTKIEHGLKETINWFVDNFDVCRK